MKGVTRRAVLLEVADKLRQKGSWCGETHIQKASFFLQELTHVPLDLDFILYKYGPYSFDLREEILSMLGGKFFEIQPNQLPYGPTLIVGPESHKLRGFFPEQYRAHVSFVTDNLGDMRVTELERLATAFYVLLNQPKASNPEKHVNYITNLKPHITADEARDALAQLQSIMDAARTQGLLRKGLYAP